jgi:AcrR family transcriptional regulator
VLFSVESRRGGGAEADNVALVNSRQSTRAVTKGERTREGILGTAAALASVEGLERLTIGRLANELGMSKSGLYGHFRSKVVLQLATIEAAREVVVAEVVIPATGIPAGLPRLRALCERFFSYLEREVFPGGCFFANVQAELNACAGPVRNRVAELGRMWLGRLEAEIRTAQALGELQRALDPVQVAFELEALMFTASGTRLLFPDLDAIGRARAAVADRLAAAAARPRRRRGNGRGSAPPACVEDEP